MDALDSVNFLSLNFPSFKGRMSTQAMVTTGGGSNKDSHNLNKVIFPNQPERTPKDIQSWRNSIIQAEDPFWPYRTLMQELFEDTVLGQQVSSCIIRRNNLTLLREYGLVDEEGNTDKIWTAYFKKVWFSHNILTFILEAKYYGYNLITLGDIIDNVPQHPSVVRRTHISPERQTVAPFLNNPAGYSWTKAPYKDWHLWVPTISHNGVSTCGMGLLYLVGMTEILMRNNLGFNTDFIEMFAQPYRWLKTDAPTDTPERQEKERAMQNMGSAGYLITGSMDELEFLTDGARGNGYKSYNDFEARMAKFISKLFLGHSDAIDSVPGKLGANQPSVPGGGTNNTDAAGPVETALRDTQSEDANFIEPVVNDSLIPMLRNLGIAIPDGLTFKFFNDAEERAVMNQETDKNQKVATLALTMAQGGLKMPAATFKKMTGIDAVDAPTENTDNNVKGDNMKDPKEQAAGKGALKDNRKNRVQKPKHTKQTV